MRKKESGATIVVVISVIATLAMFIGAALDYTFTVARNVERSDKMGQAAAIANGCLQDQFMYWREICRCNPSFSPITGVPTNKFTGIPLPTTTQFPNVSNFTATTGSGSSYTVSNYSITALTPQLVPVSGSTIPTAGIGENVNEKTYYYKGTVSVTLPDRGIPVTFNACQIFEQQYQNPWDWAIFFNDPLEIHPGPAFFINGWVQTNSSLWTGHSSLTFGDKVTYGTTWTIGFMPGDGDHNSDVPAAPSWQPGIPPVLGEQAQPFGLNASQIFNTTDPNNNNDGYHELIEVPNPSYSDPLSSERYFDQAGAKVLLATSGNTITATIYDNSAAATTSSLGHTIGTLSVNTSNGHVTSSTSGTSPYQTALATTIESALNVNQSLQDNREGTTVAITGLDVGTITNAIHTNSNLSGFNQIIYIDDTSASSSNERGIELTDGSVLPATGLTIASGNPVYVVGDYNTGVAPPSDTGITTQPTAPTYTRAPASIVADAVNILSNSWTNSESTNSLSGRPATNTTINAAIMSGNVPTGNGNYSGGAENFPRFLEDWSNATLTYYGSMVELYASQQATGVWGSGNVYNPPTRAWYYDTKFQSNPPPGSIMNVTYLKGQWYQQ
jgi:hypothetical protein